MCDILNRHGGNLEVLDYSTLPQADILTSQGRTEPTAGCDTETSFKMVQSKGALPVLGTHHVLSTASNISLPTANIALLQQIRILKEQINATHINTEHRSRVCHAMNIYLTWESILFPI